MIMIGDSGVKFGKFPNGESNLNFNTIAFYSNSTITLKYETDQDLFNLYILKQYIDSVSLSNSMTLQILYMPYSRMDRANPFYTFNLQYVCKFINSMNFRVVEVIDAHSDVTLALLDRCRAVSKIPELFKTMCAEVKTEFVIMYPDAGAEKRYSEYFRLPSVVGSKRRGFADGSIQSYEISGVDVKDKDVVIIDDLCSRGGTFVAAAKALKEKGALNVYLVTTHCEDTVLEGELFNWITKMFTTNSILSNEACVKLQQGSQMNITKLYELTQRY